MFSQFPSQDSSQDLLSASCSLQMTIEQLGYIPPPPLPMNVTGELDLTQGFGPMDNGTAATRGYVPVPSAMPYFSNASQVSLCSAHKPDS